MEEFVAKPNYFENFMFLVLGALCSVVVSLGTFGAFDNRSPASVEAPTPVVSMNTQIDFYSQFSFY